MVTKGLNKITQNETQDLQLVDNFCKSWGNRNGASDGNRTRVSSLGSCSSTIELHSHFEIFRLAVAPELAAQIVPNS